MDRARFRSVAATLTVMLADIDNFKMINDTFSHAAGDRVLKTVAALFGTPTRRTELPATAARSS